MKFVISPYIGAGEIKLLMSRVEIRSILTIESAYEEFYRTTQSKVSSDHFKKIGLVANYDENNLCDSLEFYSPAKLIFSEIDLLEMSYKGIFNYFKKNDQEIEEDDSGFTSYKYGIGIYAPYKTDDPLEKIESVIIFKRNYYS